MRYDFTTIMDRRGHDALAVDAIGDASAFAPAAPDPGFDAIPMWVADMNFPVLPAIQASIIKRTEHPAFGYFETRDEYYDSIIKWHSIRNNVSGLTRDAIGYENGVLGGVVSALGVTCSRGDSVLVHSPTYIGFTGTLKNNGYNIVLSPLEIDEGGVWRMNFEDMEKKIRDNHIHAAIFCSPHNPCGRVWEKWELLEAYRLFEKYDVTVISDEIWSDIILNGHSHIPSQRVNDYARMNTVALYAPSKTFNLAGLIGSYHIIYDPYLRDRVRKESSLCHYNSINVLSMHALIGAYSDEGYVWVDELREVLSENVNFAVDYICKNFSGVTVQKPEGTYMLFADCDRWLADHGKTLMELETMCHRVGVALQGGAMFNGPTSLRINLALPKVRVEEAMERLHRYVFY